MNDAIIYITIGAAGYAVLKRLYRNFFDGTAAHVDAFATENRRLSDAVTLLTRENEDLRRQLAARGDEYNEPAYIPRLRSLIAERRLIEAIKQYREATGAGLKEAKDFVEALARSNPSAPTTSGEPPAQLDRITGLLISGNKLAAIRDYRQATGASLAEAKAHVEEISRALANQK